MTHGAPKALTLKPAGTGDLPFILALERSAAVRPFVCAWSEEDHMARLADERWEYLLIERSAEPAGYAILDHRPTPFEGVPAGAVDLVRLAIAAPGRGTGRASLRALMAHVFADPHVPALSLDVLAHNSRARRLYLSEGLRVVGSVPALITGQPGDVMVLDRP